MAASFADIGVSPFFTERLASRQIVTPTSIQSLVIPLFLKDASIIFRSATGTGKTFAYLIPAMQRILERQSALEMSNGALPYGGPEMIVCAPSYELCSQIKQEADFLLDNNGQGSEKKPKTALLIGSGDINRQIDSLKKNKPLFAIGNPGRLLLLAKMGKLRLSGLHYLVLDEADRLTAKESRDEMTALLQIISAKTGGRAQPLAAAACSATVSGKTGEMLSPIFDGARLAQSDEHEILRERIEHWAVFSESRRKTQTLISFITAVKPKKILVFTGRAYDAGKIASVLQRKKIAAAGLFSSMGKKERKESVDRFRSGKASVLISSDLAARGLDIPGISHVAALDVSENAESYIHRAGRTGRAGKRGIMLCIGDEVEMRRLAVLEKKLGIKVQPKELYQGKLLAPHL